jgi:hypothetical protein
MNKKKALVSYYKEVLDKISFADRATFRKELRKAFRRLLPHERQELKEWFRTSCVCKLTPAEEWVLQPVPRPAGRV